MATQPCPGILELRLMHQVDGQPVENVIHVDNKTGAHWTGGSIDVIAACVLEWWRDNMRTLLPSQVTLEEILATDLTDLAGLRRSTPVTTDNVGTRASPMLPLNVTKAMELFTGNRGKGVNGHFYWPALSEDMVAGDNVDGTVLGLMQAALQALIVTIPGTIPTAVLSVLSRYLNKAKRTNGIGRDVTSCEAPNTYCDTQKDRLPGHKRKKKKTPTP